MSWIAVKESVSIKEKLLKIQLFTCTIVLVSSIFCCLLNDYFLFRKSVIINLESSTQLLSRTLAATLSFMDQKEAEKTLSYLGADKSLISAVVFDNKMQIFAKYGAALSAEELSLATSKALSPSRKNEFRKNYIWHFEELKEGNDILGALVVKADLLVVAKHFYGYFLILGVICSGGFFISWLLARLLQGSISKPLIELSKIAKSVSETGNFSIRVPDKHNLQNVMEIQTLAVQLNQMLEQIETKNREIKDANNALEEKVILRTNELKSAQHQALENAHAAGMAEIATGVLHNIGNIMNSVNISAEEISRTISSSCAINLKKTADLIEQNLGSLSEYLGSNPKGKLIPEYLIQGTNKLLKENEKLKLEASELKNKVSLIKEVIHTQQDYAKLGLFMEELPLGVILDEVVSLQVNSLARHGVKIVKKYECLPKLKVQRIKLAHILMNLIKNAKEAMTDIPIDQRTLTLEINRNQSLGVYIKIKDQGYGIANENLEKIFNHGFTTKSKGHGFGLHFCANSMAEMNGKILVESEGQGKGSSFILVFSDHSTIQEAKL